MLISNLYELIFPSRCTSCGILGPSICSSCRSQWNPHIYRNSIQGIKVYSAIRYSMTAQKIILGAKESGYRNCDDLIVKALKTSLDHFVKEVGTGVLVPIPSRKNAERKRGRSFISDLTTQLKFPYEEALILHKRVRDQSGLTEVKRAENLHDSMRAISMPSGDVILIDDVVTTGATLYEAKKALSRRGIHVKGAITAVMA